MPLMSFMPAEKLPQKPWRTDAVGRFIASIIICWLSGIVVLSIVSYYEGPHKSSTTAAFLAYSCGALVCFAGSLVAVTRPWPFEIFLRKLLVLLLLLYGGFFLMWLAERLVVGQDEPENSVVNVLIGVLSFQGMVVVLACFFLRQHGTDWMSGFGFEKHAGFALLLGACAGLIAFWAAGRVLVVSSYVLELLNFHPQEQGVVISLRGTEGWKARLIMAVVTIAIAPLGEEILFRGILYPWIKRVGHPQLALWITSLIFAAIHVNLATFVPLVFLAVVLVALYEYTGNLLASILTHMVFNAANFIALYTYFGPK
jgi:membrane protease YdiL (CAAX protease family)